MTLLVGLSGVGKSQILHVVEYSLKLVMQKDVMLRPYMVIMAIDVDGIEYVWTYRIEIVIDDLLILDNQNKYCFGYEKLTKDGDVIFERTK